MCWLAFATKGQRSRSPQAVTRKTRWIQYLRKYFHQNWVMYVPAPETYWLGQKVKAQGHSRRRHDRRRQHIELHLVHIYICSCPPQSIADILLLLLFEKKRSLYIEILLLVSILSFSLSSACDSVPNYQILYELDDQRQSYDVIVIFQDGDHAVTKFTSVFGYVYVSRFWRYKAICVSHFDQISQSTAEILLLPVPKSKRSSYWNSTSGFHIDLFTVVSMWFYFRFQFFFNFGSLPNLSKLDDRRRHIEFTRWQP